MPQAKQPAVGDKIEMFKLGVVTVEAIHNGGAFTGFWVEPDGLQRKRARFEPKEPQAARDEIAAKRLERKRGAVRARGRARRAKRGRR